VLCQSCGRRSPDSKSFCEHCGAVASPDVGIPSLPRPSIPHVSAAEAGHPLPPRVALRALSTLVFWAIVAGTYWALGDDWRRSSPRLLNW
jgi:hypothetical protein